jgi:hypothetical protein
MNRAFGETVLKSVQIHGTVLDPLNAEYCEQCAMQGKALPTYLSALRMACVFLHLAYRLRVNRSTGQ